MKIVLFIILFLFGLIPLVYMSSKERNGMTHWKIMLAASFGAIFMTGLIGIVLLWN